MLSAQHISPVPQLLKTGRSHEENKERAYVAASRRTDRDLNARIESAKRASKIHKQRTGRAFRITAKDVLNENMYEEEEEERLSSEQLPSELARRVSAYARSHITDKSALAALERLDKNWHGPQQWGPSNFAAAQPWLDEQRLLMASARSASADKSGPLDTTAQLQSPQQQSPRPSLTTTSDDWLSPTSSNGDALTPSAVDNHMNDSDVVEFPTIRNGTLYPTFESFGVDHTFPKLSPVITPTPDGSGQTLGPLMELDTREQDAKLDVTSGMNADASNMHGILASYGLQNTDHSHLNVGGELGYLGFDAGNIDTHDGHPETPLDEYWSHYFGAAVWEEDQS